jgi:hypothetical protein
VRYELSNYEWTDIKPMLPNKPRRVRRVNNRRVLNGISGSYVPVRRGAILWANPRVPRTVRRFKSLTMAAACPGLDDPSEGTPSKARPRHDVVFLRRSERRVTEQVLDTSDVCWVSC